MRRSLLALPLAAALSVLSAPPVRAGLAVTFESKSPDEAAPRSAVLRVEPDRLSVEIPGEPGRRIVFRGDRDLLWIVDADKKSYTEITKLQAQQIGARIAELRPQLEERLKNLPPEQRAMAEEAMKQFLPSATGAAGPPHSYRKTGQTAVINGWSCTRYDRMQGEKKDAELWMTDWKNLGITPADFRSVDEMAEFAKELAGPFLKQFGAGFLHSEHEAGAPPGFPVRTVRNGPDGTTTEELKKVLRQQNPAAAFEVPAGFEKETFEGMDAAGD